MSGGVDSSVAAAIAAESGVETIGVTMHLAGAASRCCSLDDADDARRVAAALGIRFYVANYAERFRAEVIERFADGYLHGETPIPCVACNKRFKFDHLMERAKVFGATRVATGHYARIERDESKGRARLLRAVDREKDQSYFLFQLDQEQLAQAWFPLGALRKEEVREQARALGLVTADKPESQEICFVPDGDYAAVVEAMRPAVARGRAGGDIVDASGRVLGRHEGVHRFTVGQRKGLGLSTGEPLYVVRIDAARSRVVVGRRAELASSRAHVRDVHWVAGVPPAGGVRACVRVRHGHVGTAASVEPATGGAARVSFDEPVEAVSPGQAAVFYGLGDARDEVLGGGWLARESV